MNVFNRVVMVLKILALFALVVLLLLFPREVALIIQTTMGSVLELLNTGQFFIIFVAVCGVVLLLLLVLLWLELRHPQAKTVRISAATGGDAQLGIQSVAQSLQNRIDELAGVRKVEAHVLSHTKDVEVLLNLDTSPSVNVPKLSDQIVELTRDIVETQLGLKIRGKVRINVRHEPYPKGTMPGQVLPAVNSSAAKPLDTAGAAVEPFTTVERTWNSAPAEASARKEAQESSDEGTPSEKVPPTA